MDVTIPADLSTLSDDELTSLIEALVGEFDSLHDSGSTDIAALTELAEGIEAVNAQIAANEAATAEAAEQAAALHARVHPVATETPTEPDPDDDDDAAADPPAEPEGSITPDLVTAGGNPMRPPAARPSAGAIARRAPRPTVPAPTTGQLVITASADVPGLVNGSQIDRLQLAQGFHDRARGLSDGGNRAAVGRVDTITGSGIPVLTEDANHNAEVVRTLVAQYENNAAALVASGGWCAPSVPLFDLFNVTDRDGLFDLPSVGQTRGGVLVPSFYDIGDVGGALWTWTEAMDIAAAEDPPASTKPCLKIPCPTWTECRPEAEGLCVTHGNLSDRAWPQLTAYFIDIVVAAHLHRVSAAKIAKIQTSAGAAQATYAGPSDAAADLLGYLELQATDLRSQFRAARSRTVEVLLPEWIVPALRANMAARAGVDFMNVTDGMINSWFTTRGIRPQYASDYQPLYNLNGGAAEPAADWPTTVEALMWFAGSYIAVDGGSIDLGVTRDSTLNATNDFTAAWSEQFFCVVNVGPPARRLSIALDLDGVTACCAAVAP